MSEWQPIETAPRDVEIIGYKNGSVCNTKVGKYYVKWPHQPGGPTFREEWNKILPGSIYPWTPTHWMPLTHPTERLTNE